MFGLSGTVIIALALATAVGLVLVIVLGALRGVTRIVARSFFCPVRRQNVTAEFREEAWDGRRVEVTRCTAFTPPEAITCEKLCLHPKEFRSVRTEKVGNA